MKKLTLLILMLILYSAFAFAQNPLWLFDAEKAFPSKNYIHAVGEGNSVSNAKNSALNELNAYFLQTVSSESFSKHFLTQKDSDFSENADVFITVNSTSQNELILVQFTDSFFDRTSRRYYICAFINRNDAWNVLSRRMNTQILEYKSTYSAAQKEADDFKKILILEKCRKKYEDFSKLYQTALVIDSKKAASFDDFIKSVTEDLSELNQLKNRIIFSIFTEGDRQNRIQNKIKELFSQNGFTVSSSNSSTYKVYAKISWNESVFNEVYFSKPQIEIVISKNQTVLVSFSASCEELSAYNQRILERISVLKLEELLDEYFEDFYGDFESLNHRNN